jgi:hypothetical protein
MKTINTIPCPNCQIEISIDDALRKRITGDLESDLKTQYAAQKAEHAEKMKELALKQQQLEKSAETIKQQLAQQAKTKLEADKIQIIAAAEARGKAAAETELEVAKDELTHTKQMLDTARKQEIELRKEKQRLQTDKQAFELEKQRQLDIERNKIMADAKFNAEKEYEMQLKQERLKNEQLTKMSVELKRKAEQGSQQAQGEVMEIGLENALTAHFPLDLITPISKGVSGADSLNVVRGQLGKKCGQILWETKNTKEWNNGWIAKLKVDQRNAKADIAIIVSATLPTGVKNVEYREGVWICSYDAAMGLAMALRHGLQNVALITAQVKGNSEKMTIMYNYLCSVDFRHHIEAMLESFVTMKADIQRERTAANKNYDKREKQLLVIESHVGGMYGDLQGLLGTELPEIKALEGEDQQTDEEDNDIMLGSPIPAKG